MNLIKILVQTSYYSLTGIVNKERQHTKITIPLGMHPIQHSGDAFLWNANTREDVFLPSDIP